VILIKKSFQFFFVKVFSGVGPKRDATGALAWPLRAIGKNRGLGQDLSPCIQGIRGIQKTNMAQKIQKGLALMKS
jgi:hypothetical protein